MHQALLFRIQRSIITVGVNYPSEVAQVPNPTVDLGYSRECSPDLLFSEDLAFADLRNKPKSRSDHRAGFERGIVPPRKCHHCSSPFRWFNDHCFVGRFGNMIATVPERGQVPHVKNAWRATTR